MTGTGGVRTAAELALDGLDEAMAGLPSAVSLDDGEADLFSAGGSPMDQPAARDGLGELGAAIFGAPRKGGAGRPKGSRNRQTTEFRTYFLQQHRHPALALADVYNMPVEELAARLGCDRHDAMRIQVQAATAVLPYVERRQPLAVQMQGASGLTLVIGDLHQAGSKSEEYQTLTLTPSEGVGSAVSVGLPIGDADQAVSDRHPLILHQPVDPAAGAAGGVMEGSPDPAGGAAAAPLPAPPGRAPPQAAPPSEMIPPFSAQPSLKIFSIDEEKNPGQGEGL